MQEMMAIYWPNRKNWKTEPNWVGLVGSVTKSNRFGSVLQKLAKTEPNRPMLTPKWDGSDAWAHTLSLIYMSKVGSHL